MTITLSPDQLVWIEARVARGESLAAIDRGDTMTLEKFEARLDAKFGTLRD